ncbi:hypothetical protein AB0M52_33025, partial [Micromonospora sp. NPDC051296]
MPADPATTSAVDDPGSRTARRAVGLLALAAVLPALYLPNTVHDFFDLKIYMSAMDWWAAG